jgi:ABC-type lipoprotein export system ATPase subunit/GNAT superfamily N-acetyltransferase
MSEIKLTNEIINDEFTKYVYDKFDIQDQNKTTVNVQFDLTPIKGKQWNIGVIYGSSGCGKTTILKALGKIEETTFDHKKALISNFDFMDPEDAARVLTSMGLSSVPTWLRPFHTLSNGEQYRAALAMKVAKAKDGEIILIDEFTSVVDREVAKAMSFALQKYVRKHSKKIVLASCHFDIMEWLMPDWTVSPQKDGGVLKQHDCRLKRRPNIKLQVHRVEHGAWDIFKKHHYLTENVSKSCKFFLFTWNDRPVGMCAVIAQPSGQFKKGVRGSRTVVLPDFQGLGIGTAISNFCAGIYDNDGYRYYTKTIHPAIGEYRNRTTDIWAATAANGKSARGMGNMKEWNVMTRPSYCHRYVGPSIEGYSELLLPVGEMRKRKKARELAES